VNLGTRLQAVRDLSQAPDRETIRLLIGALENGNWQVREGAFDALTGLGDVTIPFLCEALIDTNDQVVWRVSLILGALKAKGAAGQIISLLGREGVIRECAIWSLGEIGDTTASTALLKFIHAGDPVLRHEAETALLKIGNANQKNQS
jgi:HEAT repeat protein